MKNSPSHDTVDGQKLRAAIVYHFFANYRVPVINELMSSEVVDYVFVADTENRLMPGVETWEPEKEGTFVRARCVPFPFGSMFQFGLVRLAWRRDLDCIIYLGNWKWPMTWLSAMIARCRGKRVLFWTHGWKRRENGLLGRLRDTFYRIAHGLLLYGNRAYGFASEKKFPSSSLYVVFNSLDHLSQTKFAEQYDEQDCRRTRENIFGSNEAPIVICCARIHVRKRLTELLYAVKLLKDQQLTVNVILVGDGDDKQRLEILAQELDINVHFEGACFEEERIAELTMASNVTVSPGPVGLTVVQSLAYGVPVITNDDFDTQGPEFEAIVPGKTGDFFEAKNVEDLAAKIKKWTSVPIPTEQTRYDCMRIIDQIYNPAYQANVIQMAVQGKVVEKVDLNDVFKEPSNSASHD